jgi:hypothetical protein
MHVCVYTMWQLCCLLVCWCETVQLEWEGQARNEWVRTNKEDTYGRKPARGSKHLSIKTMQDVFVRRLKQMAIQCTDLLLCNYSMPIEAVVVISCNITCVSLYLSVHLGLTTID